MSGCAGQLLPFDEHRQEAERTGLRVRAGLDRTGGLDRPSRDGAAALLDSMGVCLLEGALDPGVVGRARVGFEAAWAGLEDRMRAAGVATDQSVSFREVSSRQQGRFDVHQSCCGDGFVEARRHAEAVLGGLFRDLLGEEAGVGEMAGVVLNLPGSVCQSFHRDSKHLFEAELPPHAFVVFIPLVPMVELNGPTHFKPASHKWSARLSGADVPTATLWPEVGSVTVWDYRLLHRGRRNFSDSARPVMYLVACKPWFRDPNYSQNAFETSIFDPDPGQGAVPASRVLPSLFDLMFECDPCLGPDATDSDDND